MYNEKDDFQHHESEYTAFIDTISANNVPISEQMKVLDLGAGQGMHAGFLGQKFNEVYCSDIVNYSTLYGGEFCKLLREKYDRNGYPIDLSRTHFIKTDGMDLLYKDAFFDFIVTFNAFEHLPDPKKSLDEMIRCTKTGGYLFIQFDPIWTTDTGSHFSHQVPEPWAHLIYPENEYIDKMKAGGAQESDIQEFMTAMNRRRLAFYRTLFHQDVPNRGFDVVNSYTWSGVSDPKHEQHPFFRECIKRGYTKEELLLRGMRYLLKVTERKQTSEQKVSAPAASRPASSIDNNDLFDVLMFWVYRLSLQLGDTAVDIGANQGVHTQVLADAVGEAGRVYAFEPVPFLFHELQSRFERHRQVAVFPYASSSAEGPVSFYVNLLNVSFCSGLQKQENLGGIKAYPITVEARRLDSMDLDGRQVNLMKIDVEGAELHALRGANDHIARHRPVCVFEWGDAVSAAYGTSSADMWDFWKHHEYTILDIRGRRLSSSADFCRSSAVQDLWNYVAVPKEDRNRIENLAGALQSLWMGMIVDDSGRKYRSTLAFGEGTPKQLSLTSPYDHAKLKTKITNRSNFAWVNMKHPFYADVPSRASFETNVRVGLRWFRPDGTCAGEDRRELSVPALFPGQSLDLDLTLYPYTCIGNEFLEPGEYRISFGLVHELVTWFSSAGDEELSLKVIVS